MPKFLSSLMFGRRARRSRRSPVSFVPGLIGQADSEVLEDRMLLAAQLVASDVTAMTVSAGDSISIPVTYQTLDDAGTAAALQANLIGFNLHFDSDALTYVDSADFFAEGIQVVPNATRLETDATVSGDDNDAATDTVLVASYSDADFALNLGWPNSPVTTPLTLYTANFTVNAGFTGTTNVNFSANASGNVIGQSAEFDFQSASVVLSEAVSGGTPVFDAVDYFPATNNPTLSWGAVDGATDYEVWIGRISPNQSRILAAESTTTATSFTASQDYTPGFYRAWVRADSGEWSEEVAFEIKPTLVNPVSATFEARPTFEWDAIPEAPGYQLFVRSTDDTFGTDGDLIVNDIPAGTTTWTPDSDLPEGSIRWWVRPSDAIGNRGWSDVGVTRMDGRADVLSVSASTITWTPVSGSSRYVLMVQDTATDEIVVRLDQLQGTSYDLENPLASGTTYRTWVKAIDASTNLFMDSLWSRGLDATI